MTTEPSRTQQWDQRYQSGDLPWDSGLVDEHLQDALGCLTPTGAAALEIGCGTGTNAIALARAGFRVTATDLSPTAIARAQAKAREAGVTVEWRVHDILDSAPVPPGSVAFVYDRGVFHSVPPEHRPTFARRVAEALGPGSHWLSICGNADDTTAGGPPRMTAGQIAALVEPLFEVQRIARSRFSRVRAEHSDTYLCWCAMLRKR